MKCWQKMIQIFAEGLRAKECGVRVVLEKTRFQGFGSFVLQR